MKELLVLILLTIPIAYSQINNTLPIELSYFNGEAYPPDSIRLVWGTLTEVSNFGWQIERKDQLDSNWVVIAFVSGSGTSNSPKDYTLADTSVDSNMTYSYRLKQYDSDGKYGYSKIVQIKYLLTNVIERQILSSFELYPAFPNPFNPGTNIKLTANSSGYINLNVYNLLGKKIFSKRIYLSAGQTYKNYLDFSAYSSGVYFLRVNNNKNQLIRKLIYIR